MSNRPPMNEESLYRPKAESDPALNELLRVSASLSQCSVVPIRRSVSDDLRSDEDYGASWFQEDSEESVDLRTSLQSHSEKFDYQSLPNTPPLPYTSSFVLSRSRPTSIEKGRYVPEPLYSSTTTVLTTPTTHVVSHHEFPPSCGVERPVLHPPPGGHYSHHHQWSHEIISIDSQESMPGPMTDSKAERRPVRIDYGLTMDRSNSKSDKACNAANTKEAMYLASAEKPGLSVDAKPFVPNTYRIMSSIV